MAENGVFKKPKLSNTAKDNFSNAYDDTRYLVNVVMKQYSCYPEILNAMRDGTGKVELKKRYMIKAIDELWINAIEDCLPALDAAIRTPSKFIEEREEVMPIELSRNISSRSLQHLSQHTDYISKIEGDKITPSRILNVFHEETMMTYENKFINTLIYRLYVFVSRRYDIALEKGQDEKDTILDFNQEFSHGKAKGKLHFTLELDEPPEDNLTIKNYTYTTDLWQRVVKLYNICRTYEQSEFAVNMGKNYIHPPVMRTNAISKNKNLRQCLALWDFIESYDESGCNMLVDERLEDIPKEYIKDIYSFCAIQYMAFRHNIENEFKADRTLAKAESDAPISPEIVDELIPTDSSEFNTVYKTEVRTENIVRVLRSRRMTNRDKQMLEAVSIALEAEKIISGNQNI